MVGKLTRDDGPTCSTLATMMGENPYKSRVEQLADFIRAKKGEDIRIEQNSIMRMGDVMEPTLLTEAQHRLGLSKIETDINQAVKHSSISLEGSLDGLCYTDAPLFVKTDATKGIYVMTESGAITLSGEGVMECKITSTFPEDVPANFRGPIQLQGLMDIKNASYGVLVVLYQSIHFKIFIYPKLPTLIKKIHETVNDFERRINDFDYFPPESANDAVVIYPDPEEAPIELESKSLDYIDLYNEADFHIKYWKTIKDDAQVKLMDHLGNHLVGTHSFVSNGVKTDYTVKWGKRTVKAKPPEIKPAVEGGTFRSKTITIKEEKNEL